MNKFAPRGKFIPLRAGPMLKKQNVLCSGPFIVNAFLTRVMHMRNVGMSATHMCPNI